MMDNSNLHALHSRSHLFTLRLWIEELSVSKQEVRMQVKHVLTGETHCFRDWLQMAEYLERKLYETNQTGHA